MNRLLNTTILFICIFLISGCDQLAELSQPSPEQILNEYFEASRNDDLNTAYSKLSGIDQQYKSLEDFKGKSNEFSSFKSALASKTTYEIQSILITGNNAIAKVKETKPDVEQMVSAIMAAAFASAFSSKEDSKESLSNDFEKKLADGSFPMKTTNEEYKLIKENTGWKVYLDFRSIQEEQERKEKIALMLDDAKKLREKKEYVKAIEIYSDVLKEDGDNSKAGTALKETETELAEEKVKQDYVSKVKIFDFEATRIDTYTDKNIPALRFAVKNEGDRTLNKVQVTVYFKDVDGNTIFEEDFHPVLVSEYSFRGSKPLKPNYIQRQEQGKYFTVKELGKEWKTGAVEALVTDIEFAVK